MTDLIQQMDITLHQQAAGIAGVYIILYDER